MTTAVNAKGEPTPNKNTNAAIYVVGHAVDQVTPRSLSQPEPFNDSVVKVLFRLGR